MLTGYLRQRAQHSSVVRDSQGDPVTDQRGQMRYGAAKTVRCRTESRIRELLTAQSQTIRVERVYYLTDPVQVDDLLDARRVQDVIPWVGLGGRIMGYKAVV